MLPLYANKDLQDKISQAVPRVPAVPEPDLGGMLDAVFQGLEHAMLKASRQFKRFCICEGVRTVLRLSGL